MKTFMLFVSLVMSQACAHIQTVSITQIPADRSKVVTAEAEKFVFLGFTFDNDFVDTLSVDLAAQCPKGDVRGIFTKDEVKSYFIAHTRRVTSRGYCVK